MTKQEILDILYGVRIGWSRLEVGPIVIHVYGRGWRVVRLRGSKTNEKKSVGEVVAKGGTKKVDRKWRFALGRAIEHVRKCLSEDGRLWLLSEDEKNEVKNHEWKEWWRKNLTLQKIPEPPEYIPYVPDPIGGEGKVLIVETEINWNDKRAQSLRRTHPDALKAAVDVVKEANKNFDPHYDRRLGEEAAARNRSCDSQWGL